MKTITLQIGNTDDKLTQAQWSRFVHHVDVEVRLRASHIYFHGFPPSNAGWQNACWVFDLNMDLLDNALKNHIRAIATTYRQDAVAWTEGDTTFI